ncbi:dTDP-4-dehydrorhamnose reductase [Bordetella genomosp. 13]|uniref:dTDP-4-dehydrorhamnose reductase n=1 Tax=Bordetella genomosp. 13 TaxID=463040 RepID=UPI0011A3F9BA|nr:dTDP-4-dehydrorhamnose reductase [Bordetella genomosp. 13]
MKLLLLGAAGQLGRALAAPLGSLGDVTALDRAQADLDHAGALRDVVRAHAPDVIVNAAAYTAVDRAEHEPAIAQRINADAVGVLADLARERAALLVHYSTDYVFDGSKAGAYLEDDVARPLNAYGRSKLAGEQAVHASGCRALVLRTSWVYAAHGENFVRTVLALAARQDTLRMVSDQVGAPTSASRVADVTAQAIAAHQAGRLASGLYHLTAAGKVDRHALACRIVARAGARTPLRLAPERIAPVATPEDPSRARRPRNSVLDSTALSRALAVELPDWRVDLDAVVDALTQP